MHEARNGNTRRRVKVFVPVLVVGVALASLVATAMGGTRGTTAKTISVAIVANGQMQDIANLTPSLFTKKTGINVKYTILDEGKLRQVTTRDVGSGGKAFDVVMIGPYEAPQFGSAGLLKDLTSLAKGDKTYQYSDLIPAVRNALSANGHLYASPFYGESSFLMYRKDLMAEAGITMPLRPTWDQVGQIAAQMHTRKKGLAGICLRGDPGWGENLAPMNTVINSFGGRWYDLAWQAQLTSPEVERAVSMYVSLVRTYGEPGAPSAGFSECATLYGQGDAAMWYDATSAVGSIEDPQASKVAGRNGYAWAPTQNGRPSGWLYTWSLAIPTTCPNKQAAWDFIAWMTSKSYIKTVGQTLGWSHVPPGSRFSSYQIPQYKKLSAAYGRLTLQSINATNTAHPTTKPVPYTGIQFLDIPEFQDLGTNVSQQMSAAIAGQKPVAAALSQSQLYAQDVGDSYKK